MKEHEINMETTCRWCKYRRWYLEGKKYGCNAGPNENICPSYRPLSEEYSADYIKSVTMFCED